MCIPVNKLSPEILSKVFECRTSEQDLVIATHVCQHWRSTLVSSPSLWTCFRFTSSHDVDRTLTYLERSKSAPIDVKVTDIDLPPRDFEVFEYLAPHIARTRSLIIKGNHTGVRAASLLFCTSSPTLQYLKVRAYRGLVRLPDDFLGRQAPSLSMAFARGSNPTFHSLTWLSSGYPCRLVRVHSAWVRSSSSSSCPSLRGAHIVSWEVPQDIALDQVISLDSLVELSYTCRPVGRILPCLTLPRLKRLRVSTSFEPGQEQKLTDVLPTVAVLS